MNAFTAYGTSHLKAYFCGAETVAKLRFMVTFRSQSSTSCTTVHTCVYVYVH